MEKVKETEKDLGSVKGLEVVAEEVKVLEIEMVMGWEMEKVVVKLSETAMEKDLAEHKLLGLNFFVHPLQCRNIPLGWDRNIKLHCH